MKILILGIGDKIPTFISRRLNKLNANGIELIIVTSGKNVKIDRSQFYKVIHINRFRDLTPLEFILTLVRFVLNIRFLVSAYRLKTDLPWLRRVVWAGQFYPLLKAGRIDLLHFQWVANVPEFSALKSYYKCPLVASVRGSQVTIYPYTRPDYRRFIQKAFENADHLHCVSQDLAEQCRLLGAQEQKLMVNYNGINVNVFCALNRERSKQGPFKIISVGTLMWRKGYTYQLIMMRELLRLGVHCELTIIGSGPDKEGLEYSSYRLGVQQHVRFVGEQKQSQVIALLQESDLYISTSAAEGLANSVVEAIACGLPVYAFEAEGMKEAIRDDRNGRIIPYGDVTRLAEEVAELIKKPELVNSMRQHSRKIAEDMFNEESWTQEMINFYKRIVNK